MLPAHSRENYEFRKCTYGDVALALRLLIWIQIQAFGTVSNSPKRRPFGRPFYKLWALFRRDSERLCFFWMLLKTVGKNNADKQLESATNRGPTTYSSIVLKPSLRTFGF